MQARMKGICKDQARCVIEAMIGVPISQLTYASSSLQTKSTGANLPLEVLLRAKVLHNKHKLYSSPELGGFWNFGPA